MRSEVQPTNSSADEHTIEKVSRAIGVVAVVQATTVSIHPNTSGPVSRSADTECEPFSDFQVRRAPERTNSLQLCCPCPRLPTQLERRIVRLAPLALKRDQAEPKEQVPSRSLSRHAARLCRARARTPASLVAPRQLHPVHAAWRSKDGALVPLNSCTPRAEKLGSCG
jgi:hypothetical protein